MYRFNIVLNTVMLGPVLTRVKRYRTFSKTGSGFRWVGRTPLPKFLLSAPTPPGDGGVFLLTLVAGWRLSHFPVMRRFCSGASVRWSESTWRQWTGPRWTSTWPATSFSRPSSPTPRRTPTSRTRSPSSTWWEWFSDVHLTSGTSIGRRSSPRPCQLGKASS